MPPQRSFSICNTVDEPDLPKSDGKRGLLRSHVALRRTRDEIHRKFRSGVAEIQTAIQCGRRAAEAEIRPLRSLWFLGRDMSQGPLAG